MMEHKTNIARDVNHFPSVTWHHLHINHGHFAGGFDGAAEALVSALPEGVSIASKKRHELDVEVRGIQTQLGREFDGDIDSVSDSLGMDTHLVSVAPGVNAAFPVKLEFSVQDGDFTASDTVIHAGPDSSSTFIFVYEGPADASGVFGNRVRVFCERNSSVSLVTVNMLGSGVIHYSGTGFLQEDGSKADLIQIELGGRESYSGSRHELAGFRSSCSVQGGYLCDSDRLLDINYVARHSGVQSESLAKFNGVLLDDAKKTWRGSIDFEKGARDAKGDEQENVLLLSPSVLNKSMPVIFCDEEDVEGRHGGSIGKLGEEELLYLETRGIDERTAKTMMVKSRINSIARNIPDEKILDRIHAYLEEHLQ